MKFYIALLCILLTSFSVQAVTLREAYLKAKEHESIQIQSSRLKQFDEDVTQARSGILPRVNARGSYLVQQDAAIFSAPTADRSRKSLQVEVVQPLFQGFKEFAAIRLAEGERLAQMADLEKSKTQIFTQVYEVFFNILMIESEKENLEELLRLSEERVRYLERRVNIGRSRESELISAQAQKMTVRSQLEGARSRLITYRERLHSLTGLERDVSVTLETGAKNLASLDDYLQRSLGSQWVAPDRLRFEASEHRVAIAKADHLPGFDVRANYYPYREGSFEDVKWDVTLNMTIPLYSGGATSSRVRQAVESQREAELTFRLREREIREQVVIAYETLQQGRSQLSDFEQAVTLNRQNYELQQREYGLGLVSNLDVLQALNQYIQSRKDLSDLRLVNSQYYYELLALTGEIF